MPIVPVSFTLQSVTDNGHAGTVKVVLYIYRKFSEAEHVVYVIVCAKTSRSSFGIPHWRVKSIRETLKLLRWKKPIIHKQSKLAIETLSIEVSCTNQRNRISANIDRSLFLSSPHFLILGRVMCSWYILPSSSFIHKPSTYLNNKACDTSWVTTPCMGMPYHVTSYMFIWAERVQNTEF